MTEKQKDSYRYFWTRALILFILYATVHLLGFRVYTSIWAGTNTGGIWTTFAGLSYLILYLLCITIMPIYIMAGLILWFSYLIQKISFKIRSRQVFRIHCFELGTLLIMIKLFKRQSLYTSLHTTQIFYYWQSRI